METKLIYQKMTRYGFYYFPDTLHYTEEDIHTWIPELTSLGASWLTLLAPDDRAIPESFIRQIIEAGIQPILHLPLTTNRSGRTKELNLLLERGGPSLNIWKFRSSDLIIAIPPWKSVGN